MASYTNDFTGVDPTGKSPFEIELEWFRNVYRGDLPQLTARAVLMGCFLGAVMSLSNLFVGLKTGWGLGIAITACILSFSLGAVLKRIGLLDSNLTILENNCMQSAASSAGYSTGSTLVSAVSALLLIQGRHMPFWTLMAWTVLLAILGVFLAVPMKRQMINIEQLAFPSGIAAAQTLRSLYARGEAASKKARSLGIAAAFGGATAFIRENTFSWWPRCLKLPDMIRFPGRLSGQDLGAWTVSFEFSAIMVAAGAIIGLKVACSMLAGGILNYLVVAPYVYDKGIIPGPGYRNIVSWSLWGGTALMVTSGLLTFAFQWKTTWRAIAGTGRIFRSKTLRIADAATVDSDLKKMDSIEVPGSWFATGIAASGIGIVALQAFDFSISWWMGALSVLMTFFLSIVACRATGETDITPIGAMGKITQLSYGIIAPSDITANLMTAGVTAGAAASSADLLTDLKSGYLLGANPRKQFLAQFLGIFAGAVVIVPSFYLLVPTPDILGGDKFPAPSAQVWKGVAELLANGISSLHSSARIAIIIGIALGALLSVLDHLAPPRLRSFLPSAMGLGLAFVIPFWNTLSIFLGALVASFVRKTRMEGHVIPAASGIIAGESLIGVLIALLSAVGV
ncbi:MAG TPA: OPT family oligopeptide transporter [Syntrophobacteraceae bacterium]|nr:OPT family oligopeptide transporter [Syntrophobacteraceae bacterium]